MTRRSPNSACPSGWGRSPRSPTGEAQTPAWLHAALGDDKELRARALLGTLSGLMPGALVLRSTGRLLSRWRSCRAGTWACCGGATASRCGTARRTRCWPPNRLPAGPPDIAAFASALAEEFASQHWATECTAEESGRDADKEGAGGAPAWTVTTATPPRSRRRAEPLPHGVLPPPTRTKAEHRRHRRCRPRRQTPPLRPPRLRRHRAARDRPRRHAVPRRPALHRTRRTGLWLARAGVDRRHPARGRHAGAHHRHARPGRH
jgi:hypothetical protein